MKLTARVVPYSSVVGNGLILSEDGKDVCMLPLVNVAVHPMTRENHAKRSIELAEAIADIINTAFDAHKYTDAVKECAPKDWREGLVPCLHPNAEYEPGGAFCPDCLAKGTFPGMNT